MPPLRPELLLVEDDRVIAHGLALRLGQNGYIVKTAGSVAEAIRQLSSRTRYIVLDLMLPDGDGERVIAAAQDRGLDPRILVVSGTGDEDRLEAVAGGVHGVLSKPVLPAEIIQRLEMLN